MPAQGNDLSTDPLLTGVPLHEGYKVLGGVVLYEKLGQGGMGAVYRGRHLRLDVDVALKVMTPPAGMSPEKAEDFIKRFIREARTAARIDHTNLVRVLDVNSVGGLYYLVMQFVDGESAAERLACKGRLSEGEAGRICLAAASALAEAHAKGIIHRDVKPDNIMIDRSGKVKVTDLGLAKAYAGENDGREPTKLTRTQAVLGTPYYMAPEQFASAADLGPAADVWSLGVTLCELLTGERPWTDNNVFALVEKIRDDPPPDPKELSPDLSDGICRIIEKALRKDPQERYADCGKMADALREHVRALPRSRAKSSRQMARAMKPASASATPPPAGTLSLIAASVLDVDGSGAMSSLVRAFSNRRFLWAGLGALGFVVVLGLVLAFRARPERHRVNETAEQDRPSKSQSGRATKSLHEAAEQGDMAKVRALLASGADVNTRSAADTTPLHEAASEGHTAVAKVLLDAGADVKAKTLWGASPLQNAALTGQKDVGELLLARGAGRLDIFLACAWRMRDRVAGFLETDTSLVWARDKRWGWTPLHWATHSSSKAIAELLLTNGADVNAKCNSGRTPLHTARSAIVAELMLANGAGVNTRDDSGGTPLHDACNAAIAKVLIAHGASKDSKGRYDHTPLHDAAMLDRSDVADLLLGKGVEVDAKGDHGNTPLHSAAFTGSMATARLLLAHGANVNARNAGGETPLSKAVRFGQTGMAQLLRDNGARE